MRISDWSSDVGSSDLLRHEPLSAEGLHGVAVDAGLRDLGQGRLARLGLHDVRHLRGSRPGLLVGSLVEVRSGGGERRDHGARNATHLRTTRPTDEPAPQTRCYQRVWGAGWKSFA